MSGDRMDGHLENRPCHPRDRLTARRRQYPRDDEARRVPPGHDAPTSGRGAQRRPSFQVSGAQHSPPFNSTPPPRVSYCPRMFQRESLVQELVLSLAVAGRERDALDELELCGSPHFFVSLHTPNSKQCSYLPSPPYQDNSVLHTYAGLLCLRLALSAETDLNLGAKGTYKSFHNKLVKN